jgi:NAD(P)-dependent dehydrogenase (short-subunit alcohol dehydrogenase family)
LQDRVVLITGGGGGLGEAICQVLAESGAVVIVADVRLEAAERVAADVAATGGQAVTLQLDIQDEVAAERAIGRVFDAYGRLDVLINNAGTDLTAPIEDLTVAEWDRIIGVNLRGPFVLARQALPIMKQQGGGQIVNIVSTAAKRTWANATAYHASKWGLLGFSHALHVEGRPHQVKVTAIVSGGMRTPFIFDRFPDTDPSVLQDPRNVAETVRFVLTQPAETVIPELMVLPMRETSWP